MSGAALPELGTTQGKLLALSRAMVARAEAGEWEAVVDLEAERRTLLESGAAEGAGEAFLRELLALNEQLVASAAAARAESVRAISSVQTGARAVSAYNGNR